MFCNRLNGKCQLYRLFSRLKKKYSRKIIRECSQGEMIKKVISSRFKSSQSNLVFVEVGCGLTTVDLADIGAEYGAKVYSCDNNKEKVEDLKKCGDNKLDNVTFLVGDSLETLKIILEENSRIDFIFLDSAPSALHTFREFQLVEQYFRPGSCVLIDNASLPTETLLLTPCRKGKILVPYLLASPFWQVYPQPKAGDSMVYAVCFKEPDYADPDYEMTDWVDTWKSSFAKKLN